MLTFLSHFAFAFAQCTQAIGIRSVGDSMAGCCSLVQCLCSIEYFTNSRIYGSRGSMSDRRALRSTKGICKQSLRRGSGGNVSCVGRMFQRDPFSAAFNVLVAVTEIEASVGVRRSRARGSFLTKRDRSTFYTACLCFLGGVTGYRTGSRRGDDPHPIFFSSALGNWRVRMQIHVPGPAWAAALSPNRLFSL